MVVWAIVSSLSGRMLGRADLADSGRKALVVASGMLVLALVGLIAGFVTRDFTRVYVATHSSANLPLAYAIAATWSGSAGWVLMVTAAVSVFAAIVTRTGGVRVGPESTQMIVAMGIALVIALTSVCIANPFAQFDFAAADGKGLPALQQSAGFVLVPPIEALALAAVTVACAVARQGAARARKNLLWRI